MASQYSSCAEPRALDCTVLLDRFPRVLRTGRRIPTCARQERRDPLLIETDHHDQCARDHFLSVHAISSSRSSENVASYASRLALISTSTPWSRLRSCGRMSLRSTSRSRRFSLLRCTTVRRCFGTITPIRGYTKREVESKTSRWTVLLLFPFVISARISLLLVMRRDPGRRCLTRTSYLEPTVTVSCLRPFLRREFRTSRPAAVFMRARKPCLFLRFRLCGLYVGCPISILASKL